MKRFIFKLVVGVITILVLGLLITVGVDAGSQCYPSSGNCLTLAQYYHTVWNNSGSYWDAGVRSYTANPTRVMDDIGYSYWTVRQRCYGSIIQQTNYGGHVLHYRSSYWAAVTKIKAYCSNPYARLGESLGNHDFYDWPYSHIYPYSYEDGWIP